MRARRGGAPSLFFPGTDGKAWCHRALKRKAPEGNGRPAPGESGKRGGQRALSLPASGPRRCGGVLKPAAYSAASTRVLCGKYDSVLRKAFIRLAASDAGPSRMRGRG